MDWSFVIGLGIGSVLGITFFLWMVNKFPQGPRF